MDYNWIPETPHSYVWRAGERVMIFPFASIGWVLQAYETCTIYQIAYISIVLYTCQSQWIHNPALCFVVVCHIVCYRTSTNIYGTWVNDDAKSSKLIDLSEASPRLSFEQPNRLPGAWLIEGIVQWLKPTTREPNALIKNMISYMLYLHGHAITYHVLPLVLVLGIGEL